MNKFRSQASKAGRVGYVSANKPVYDLEGEAKKERAKMDGGGNTPVQASSPNKAKASAPPKMNPNPGTIGKKPSASRTMEYADILEK